MKTKIRGPGLTDGIVSVGKIAKIIRFEHYREQLGAHFICKTKKWMRISERKSVLPSTAPTRDTKSKVKYTPNQEDRRHEVARKQTTIADEPVWKSSECCCCCGYWCSPWLHVKLCNLRVFSSRNEFVTFSVRSHCTDVWEFHWSAANLSLDRY